MSRIHGEDLIVGRYTDPSGDTYAGYLEREDSFAFDEPPRKRGVAQRDLIGQWSMTYGTAAARTVDFCINWTGYGFLRGSGGSFPISGRVQPGEGGRRFHLRGVVNDNGYIDAYRMSWHSNIATGTSYWDGGHARGGVILSKVSDSCG